MKYDAFISYRHNEYDLKLAKKVHAGLEKFNIPRAIREKTGKDKISRIFRDQEELPIGSDLSGNISAALEESEYLIVICSPRTPQSDWVIKEIETFISLHDRNHVLAVLIEGEPEESFPQILLEDEDGRSVEPLAADLRGETDREVNEKYKTEIIRLAAALLDCSYDDLRQRHRERAIKRNIAIVTGVAVIVAILGIGFGIYNRRVAEQMSALAAEKAQLAEDKTELADELLTEYSEKQRNQSRYLASESLDLFEKGNVKDAVLVAMAALPSEENDRPYVPEAEYALSKALHSYIISGTASEYTGLLEHDSVVDDMNVDTEGKLTTFDSLGNVYVWDIETQKQLLLIPYEYGDNYKIKKVVAAHISGDKLFICHEHDLSVYDRNGTRTAMIDFDAAVMGCFFSDLRNKAYAISNDEIVIANTDTFEVEDTKGYPYENSLTGFASYSDESGILVVKEYVDRPKEERNNDSLISFNVDDMTYSECEIQGSYIDEFKIDRGGYLAVLSYSVEESDSNITGAYISLSDMNTGTILWTNELAADYSNNNLSSLNVHETDSKDTQVIVSLNRDMWTFDRTGSNVSSCEFDRDVKEILPTNDGGSGFVTESDGIIEYINLRTGNNSLGEVFSTDFRIKKMLAWNGTFILMSSGESFKSSGENVLYLWSYVQDTDIETLFTSSSEESIEDIFVSNDGNCIAVLPYNNKELLFYDANGELLNDYRPDDKGLIAGAGFLDNNSFFVVRKSGEFDRINTKTGEVTQYQGFRDGTDHYLSSFYITDSKKYILLEDGRNVSVLSTEDGSEIASVKTKTNITAIGMSEDASKIYICTQSYSLEVYDVPGSEIIDFEKEELRIGKEIGESACSTINISPDGEYGALFCNDDVLRIFNTSNGEVISELPCIAYNNIYLKFSPDSNTLFYQADDLILHKWDVENKSLAGTYVCEDKITDIAFIPDEGKTVIYYRYTMDILKSESLSALAQIYYGYQYLPETGKIYMASYHTCYFVPYKDYKVLLSEAKEKYGDCELYEEEKMQYFVE